MEKQIENRSIKIKELIMELFEKTKHIENYEITREEIYNYVQSNTDIDISKSFSSAIHGLSHGKKAVLLNSKRGVYKLKQAESIEGSLSILFSHYIDDLKAKIKDIKVLELEDSELEKVREYAVALKSFESQIAEIRK